MLQVDCNARQQTLQMFYKILLNISHLPTSIPIFLTCSHLNHKLINYPIFVIIDKNDRLRYFQKIKSKKITKQIAIFFVLIRESDVTTLKKYQPHSVLNRYRLHKTTRCDHQLLGPCHSERT